MYISYACFSESKQLTVKYSHSASISQLLYNNNSEDSIYKTPLPITYGILTGIQSIELWSDYSISVLATLYVLPVMHEVQPKKCPWN